MIYAYKYYTEVFSKPLPQVDIVTIGSALRGKSFLGNFLSQPGNLFSAKEMYLLKKEIEFISRYAVGDEQFTLFLQAFNDLYEYVNFTLEFLDINKNQDLLLVSLVHRDSDYCLKAYELVKIAPSLMHSEELDMYFEELSKFGYHQFYQTLVFSQGFLEKNDLLVLGKEAEQVLAQKLLSKKTLTLAAFFQSLAQEMTEKESFLLLEQYLSVYR
ncbi:MAG: hypothetical protein QW594_04205 [Candidatus Woesearchaeota archaeon]